MLFHRYRSLSLGAARLALRLAMAVASPLVTALPASALTHHTALEIAQHRDTLTAGGPFDPDAAAQRDARRR